MGIKIKSEDEIADRLVIAPVVAGHQASTDQDTYIVPFSGSLKSIRAEIGVAGTTGTATINLKKNQSNMFANATPFTWASGSTATVYDPTCFAAGTVISVTKGDKISLDVTVVQTTPAKGGAVSFVITRRPNVAVTTGNLDPQDTRP